MVNEIFLPGKYMQKKSENLIGKWDYPVSVGAHSAMDKLCNK